jgi:hypothetical protein
MSSMQWAISFQLSVTEIMQENDRIGTLGFSEHLKTENDRIDTLGFSEHISKQKMIKLVLD